MSATKVHPGLTNGEKVELNPESAKTTTTPTTAVEVINKAIYRLSARTSSLSKHGKRYSSAIESELLSVSGVYITNDVDTMAVILGSDALLKLMVNPEFTMSLGVEGAMFVLTHEVYHILYAHLYDSLELRSDEIYTLACEVVINDRAIKHLGTGGLPEADGKSTGVNPKTLYASYRKSCREDDREPVDYEQFVSTDLACRSYLAQISNPPQPRQDFCNHGESDPGDDGEDGDGANASDSGSIDPEGVQAVVGSALDSLMQRALQGDQSAKDALLELGEQVGEDHKIWGDLGLGALRGETVPTAQARFWEVFLTQALTSVITPGTRMVYPRKMAGLEPMYEAIDARVPFLPMGDARESEGSIYIDTSGSMGPEVIDRVAKLVGNIPNVTTRWRAFDASVYEFAPGDPLRGGGGTSFDIIVEHLEQELNEDSYEPDFVLVLTDGYAPPIDPPNADSWVWLVTTGGDTWPMDRGMECVIVDL